MSASGRAAAVCTAAPPTQADSRSALADWLELQALLASRARASFGTLTNVLDIASDGADERNIIVIEDSGEEFDNDIVEIERNAVLDAVFAELQYREEKLGDSYPFRIDGSGSILEVAPEQEDAQVGRTTYLFFLLTSLIRGGRIGACQQVTAWAQRIPNCFQISACLAAGGFVRGEVASFGFPRRSGDAFLPALQEVYRRFGIGRVLEIIPPGFDDQLKDGGIDVIAWRNHPDRLAGRIYLIGQCASGSNWTEKSVYQYAEALHSRWFTGQPAKFYIPAMFIPFTLHQDIYDEGGIAFLDVVKERSRYWESKFGVIFDRLRIVHYSHVWSSFPDTDKNIVDGWQYFGEVGEWVSDVLGSLGYD